MPTYEYSAWVTVKAESEEDADQLIDDAQTEIQRIFSDNVVLHIEDGPPEIEDEEDEEDDL